jgi:hypothetical protein
MSTDMANGNPLWIRSQGTFMNKRIVLFCVVLSSSFSHAMRNEIVPSKPVKCISVTSFLAELLSLSEAEQKGDSIASGLRMNKGNFKDNLIDRQTKSKIYNTLTSSTFSIQSMCQNPIQFLQYCYCMKHYEITLNPSIFDLDDNPELLAKCLTAQKDGYSALGAVMIAEDASYKERCDFIQKLIFYGFKPTENDIQLARLFFYDEVMKAEWKQLKYLFDVNLLAVLNKLPKELKQLVAQYIIEMLKTEKDCWMLPGY